MSRDVQEEACVTHPWPSEAQSSLNRHLSRPLQISARLIVTSLYPFFPSFPLMLSSPICSRVVGGDIFNMQDFRIIFRHLGKARQTTGLWLASAHAVMYTNTHT